jgi:hypothetical protein
MIRVFVEVTKAAAPLRVEVRAESIGQAVAIIEELHPGRTVEVVFPIDPEKFFVDDTREAGARQDLSRTLVYEGVGRA